MKILDLNSKKSILDLKKEIQKLDYPVYFETDQVQNFSHIVYRLRESRAFREKLEYNYMGYIRGNERKKSIAFWNPDGSTLLIIPTKGYVSISDFAKNGSDKEWTALFNNVRRCVKKGEYISTHGHGIAWLHVRLEENPKYYRW